MNRYLILALTFILCQSTIVFSQATNGAVKRDVNIFLKAMNSGQFEKMIEYVNPEHFKIVPKATMKRKYEGMTNDKMNMEFTGYELKEISESIDYKDVKYIAIDFHHDQKITLLKPLPDKEYEVMKQAFDAMIGTENWQRKGDVITMTVPRKLIGNLTSDSKNWTFVHYDEKMSKEAEKNITPKTVRSQLKLK